MERQSTPTTAGVRPARPGDVPVLLRMKRELAKAEGNEGVLRASEQDWLRDGFGAQARFRCFVAEQEAATVAVEQSGPLVQLTVLPDNPARKFYHRLGFRHLRECLTYAIGGEPMTALALPVASVKQPLTS